MNMKLTLHDGKEYVFDISNFDMDKFLEDVNDAPHQMIRFGEVGVAKHTIKSVEPIIE